MTTFWLTLIAVLGVVLFSIVFGASIRKSRDGGHHFIERDDAAAVAVRFGAADDDRVTGTDSADALAGTRVMTYRKKRSRVTFVRRPAGSGQRPVWKLVGFTESDGKAVLSGEEALRRLKE